MTQRTYAAGNLPAHVPVAQNADGDFVPLHVDASGSLKVEASINAARATVTAAITVANSTTISASVDLLGTTILAFIAPAAWTTSTLKIQGSADNSNWSDIIDPDGDPVSSYAAITAGAAYSMDVPAMLPYRYIRFVAGTGQAADRTFTVITRPLA